MGRNATTPAGRALPSPRLSRKFFRDLGVRRILSPFCEIWAASAERSHVALFRESFAFRSGTFVHDDGDGESTSLRELALQPGAAEEGLGLPPAPALSLRCP